MAHCAGRLFVDHADPVAEFKGVEVHKGAQRYGLHETSHALLRRCYSIEILTLMRITLALFLLLGTLQTQAQLFVDIAASVNADIGGAKDGGTSFVDFNNDGCIDLLVNTNHNGTRSRLLMGDCTGAKPTFTDVTATLAPELLDETLERSAVWGDFNNDGYIDFMRNRSSILEVYQNQGPNGSPAWSFGDADHDPNFEITALPGGFNCEGLAWVDYNGDGFLDIILENHNYGVDILLNPADCSANFIHITPNSSPLGLYTSATDGDYMAASDFNDDGWVDLLCRKRDQNDLLRNDGGTFTDLGNIDQATNGNKGGVMFADFDNDGDFDLFWTSNGTNQIWEQTTSGTFVPTGEPQNSSGVNPGGGIDGCAAGDIDNDGDLDLFLTDNSGASYLFVNDGSGFSFTHNNNGINVNGNGEGCVFHDFDNDGDLDLYVNRSYGNQLWENQTNSTDYLKVEALLDLGGGFTRVDHGATATLLSADGTTVKGGIRDARNSFGHGTQGGDEMFFGLPDGPNVPYRLQLHFTNIGGERIEIDTLITPSTLADQTFRYTRSSFGILTNIGCNLLPVELVAFFAKAKDGRVNLHWTTASEINNERFVIEHSTDGHTWDQITEVPGNGNSTQELEYETIHPFPEDGLNYYRLWQFDFNGTRDGPWMTAASLESEAFGMRVFPNPVLPAHRSWYAQITGIRDQPVTLALNDATGALVFEQLINPGIDQTTIEVTRTPGMRSGIYFLTVSDGSRKISRKLLFK